MDLPNIESTGIEGLKRIHMRYMSDTRGSFLEAFRRDHLQSLGLPGDFVQDNQSRSKKGVVRGLHFQWDPPLGKIIRVGAGKAFLAFVDIRKHSPTFLQVVTEECADTDAIAFYAPPGIAAGFCALADDTDIVYKYSAFYNAAGEGNIRFDDPDIGIPWPIANPDMSERDKNAPSLSEWLSRSDSDKWN